MMISSAQQEADVTSKITLEVGDNMVDVAFGEAPSGRAQDKNTHEETWDGSDIKPGKSLQDRSE